MWKWKESPFSEYTPWKTKDKDKKIENEERKWKAWRKKKESIEEQNISGRKAKKVI